MTDTQVMLSKRDVRMQEQIQGRATDWNYFLTGTTNETFIDSPRRWQ
jgi:hypothetical protein